MGFSCQPYSSMGNGDGVLNFKEFFALVQSVVECIVGEEDFVVLECTKNLLTMWRKVLLPLLGKHFEIAPVHGCPSINGAPCRRSRFYAICTRHRCCGGRYFLKIPFTQDNYNMLFESQKAVLSGKAYFDREPRQYINAMLDHVASSHKTAAKDDDGARFNFRDLIDKGVADRAVEFVLKEGVSALDEAEQVGNNDKTADINQTMHFAGISEKIPCLLKGSCMYNLTTKRALTAWGHLEVQGVSLFGGNSEDAPSAVPESIKPQALRHVFRDPDLNQHQAKILAGQSFNICSYGSVLLFLLCSAESHEDEEEQELIDSLE